MSEQNAILEVELEQHRAERLADAVDELVSLMRGVSDEPSAEVLADFRANVDELSSRLLDLLEDEELLVYPAIKSHFPSYGSDIKTRLKEHDDLRASVKTLRSVLDRLEARWRMDVVEQAWAIADHLRALFREHTESEDELLEEVSQQLTAGEHDELLQGLRARRNGRDATGSSSQPPS